VNNKEIKGVSGLSIYRNKKNINNRILNLLVFAFLAKANIPNEIQNDTPDNI